jgi:prolyl 4-hydroxylase
MTHDITNAGANEDAGTEQQPAEQAAHDQVAHEQLYQWIADRRPEGYCPAQIFNAIRAANWTREAAVAAMQHVMGDLMQPREFEVLLRGAPEPDLTDSPSSLIVEGHEVQVLIEMRNPRAVVFGGLLTDDECDQIVAIAGARMERSTVIATAESDSNQVSDIRTSFGTFLRRGDHEVCNRIDARVQALVNWPVDFTEDLQVLRYDRGAEYKPHHDFFEPAAGHWTPTLRRGGQRVGSIIMYLNTPERGGGTVFPDVPMDVFARKGNAVLFSYPDPDPATRTLHGGTPVLAGEKWAAVKWFRQGPHR